MKNKKSISSIFQQGGTPKKKVLSSDAFMPASEFYYQMGGLAYLSLGDRVLRAQNGVLASAVNAPAPPMTYQDLQNQFLSQPVLNGGMSPEAVAAANSAPPLQPIPPDVAPFTPGVTPQGFIQLDQKEGETRWQYRFDPANNVFQAFDTRRPEKGWMVPDVTKDSGKKADEAIRARYGADAAAGAAALSAEIQNRAAALQPVAKIGGAGIEAPTSLTPRTINVAGKTVTLPSGPLSSGTAPAAAGTAPAAGAAAAGAGAATTPSVAAGQTGASYEDLTSQFMGRYAEPARPRNWQGTPYEVPTIGTATPTAPVPGGFVTEDNMTIMPMNPEEAAAARQARGPVEAQPLETRPVQRFPGMYDRTNNPAADLQPRYIPTKKQVNGFEINADNKGDLTITDKKGETFRIPEELGVSSEDLAVMTQEELQNLIEEFKYIMSDKEQKNYFNVKNDQNTERPGTVPANRRNVLRRYSGAAQAAPQRMQGGYTNPYDINYFLDGGVPSMQLHKAP